MVNGGAVVRTDPTRIAAQIVTGIGFLGAGAIIRQGLSVRGLTTAATLWLVAGDRHGVRCRLLQRGADRDGGRRSLTLGPLRIYAYSVVRRFRPEVARLLVEVPAGGSPAPVIDVIEQHSAAASSRSRSRRRAIGARSTVDVQLHERRRTDVVAAVARHRRRARGAVGRTEGTSLLAQRAQGARARAAAARLDDRAARRRRLSARDRRDVRTRTRARRRSSAARSPTQRAGRSARTRASRSHALGGRPGIAARRATRPRAHPRSRSCSASSTASSDRRARYVSELVAIAPDGREVRGSGVARRVGSPTSRAAAEGFGYDPVFVPDGEERTVAELGDAWKNEHSHRARAARALREAVERIGARTGDRRSPMPPVELGAEHDHVRHHVEPEQQDHRAAEHTKRHVHAGETDEHRQHLERRLEEDRREDRAGQHVRTVARRAFVITR